MTKPSILIADDERVNIKIIANILEGEYETQAAKNGEQTLKRALALKPDLILLDIMMPDMDGYEVCRRLKANDLTKQIPVIFVSAMTDIGYEAKGLEIGAVDYITKPISPPIVLLRVKHHLERQQYRNYLEHLVEERTLELQKAKDEADQARKIAEDANKAKSNFLMNMSHELKTPLNGILAASESISECGSTPELKNFQRIIKSSGCLLLQTVDNILAYTKSKDGELELESLPFRLDEALTKSQRIFSCLSGCHTYLFGVHCAVRRKPLGTYVNDQDGVTARVSREPAELSADVSR